MEGSLIYVSAFVNCAQDIIPRNSLVFWNKEFGYSFITRQMRVTVRFVEFSEGSIRTPTDRSVVSGRTSGHLGTRARQGTWVFAIPVITNFGIRTFEVRMTFGFRGCVCC